MRELSREEAVAGATVKLSLDVEVQRAIWNMMGGVTRGAVVLLDGSSGDVIALISKPGVEMEEDESLGKREVRGVAPILEAISLLKESGGDEALVDGLVQRLGEERDGAGFGGNWDETGALYGVSMGEGEAVQATAVELARLGASLVNGGRVVEMRIGGVSGEGGGSEGGGKSLSIPEGAWEKLVSGLSDDEGVWLEGALGANGLGRWVLFGVKKGGVVYGGGLTDVEGTSASLNVLGRRVAKEVLE
ncbi:MAG: hypothetical protein AAF591_23190 [Verrucomicrobiota bacterium]